MVVVSHTTAGDGSARATSSILRWCKQDKRMRGKMQIQTGGTVALPRRHSSQASVLCTDLYSEILSTYLQSRLRVYKTEKKGDSNIPMGNGHARAVLWHQHIGQVVGCVGWQCTWSNLGILGPTCTSTLQRCLHYSC